MMYGWSGVSGYGLAHWLFFTLVVIAIVYPVGRILRRLGFSPLWSVLAFVPLVNLISLWVLALSDWPSKEDRR